MRHISGETTVLSPPFAREFDQVRNIVVFTILTAIGAKVYIPHEPVPFTLQTLFVVLSGAFLGWRNGSISMVLYLVLGATGLPIFAGAVAGPSVLFGVTGGYFFGFVLSTAMVGAMINLDRSLLWTIVSMTVGFVIIFACGTFYLNEVFIHNWKVSITQGFLIFSYWDLIKLAAAIAVYRAWPARFRTTNK